MGETFEDTELRAVELDRVKCVVRIPNSIGYIKEILVFFSTLSFND